MSNPLRLVPGKRYKVVQPFTDYDRQVHPVGETWTFVETNFLPYADGLTLHVKLKDALVETVYRLQWRPEEQAPLMEHFSDFVVPY